MSKAYGIPWPDPIWKKRQVDNEAPGEVTEQREEGDRVSGTEHELPEEAIPEHAGGFHPTEAEAEAIPNQAGGFDLTEADHIAPLGNESDGVEEEFRLIGLVGLDDEGLGDEGLGDESLGDGNNEEQVEEDDSDVEFRDDEDIPPPRIASDDEDEIGIINPDPTQLLALGKCSPSISVKIANLNQSHTLTLLFSSVLLTHLKKGLPGLS